jgi:hypothetical protein
MKQDVGSESQGNRKSMTTKLRADWAAFIGIIFSPAVVILVIVTIGLMALQLATPTATKPSPVIEAAITTIISLLSGLVGARISNQWTKVTEGGVLVTRGKSAIRGLKLLATSISAIQKRVAAFLLDSDQHDDAYKLIRQGYAELLDRCALLTKETINAIEEWQDIIPEAANLNTQIDVMIQLESESLLLKEQIAQLNTRLDTVNAAKEKSDEEMEQASRFVKEKKQELDRVIAKLRVQQSKLDETVLSGSSIYLKPIASTTDLLLPFSNDVDFKTEHIIGGVRSCPKCHKSVFYGPEGVKKCPYCGTDL